jgi:predicted nucleic acid-binding protein
LPAPSARGLRLIGAGGLQWRLSGSRRWLTSIYCSRMRVELTRSREYRWLLLDKSPLVCGADIDGAYWEPCLCAITKLEMLYSARSARAYEELELELDTFHQLRVDAETIATASTAQRELATHGQHRVPIPDLLIGACAHQHQAAVLHVDRHYDTLARVLAFTPVRLTT